MKGTTKTIVSLALMMVMMVAGVLAAGEISQVTDRINYYNAETHNVYITNNGAETVTLTASVPGGWTWSSGSGCSEAAGTITCTGVAPAATVSYTLTSTAADAEYTWTQQTITANNTYTGNDVNFLRIADDEIFHTLVEYGRGRGNYFYDSMGTTSSAGTGTGYPYVPNATDFELNYLHKIYNIKQYFDNANAVATDVSFTCTYPEHTIVRQHLTDSIARNGTAWTANYAISEIEGSWERMGFLGEDFDAGEYVVNGTFAVACNNIQYTLADLGGNISVANDQFTMTVVDINPLSVVATSGTASIGNGTSEVIISYVFTNNERYPLDDVRLEIQAPPDAQFIGTRGELWGYGEEYYQYDLVDLQPGQSAEVVLVARFDTSGDTDTALELTQGIKAEFIPSWEVNSYNPLELMQTLAPTDTIAVNYGTPASITNIQTLLENMNATLVNVNTLVTEINQTTYTIQNYVIDINGTVTNVYSVVQDIQTTVNNINTTTNNIYTDTQAIIELLDCDTVSDTPICQFVLDINSTVTSNSVYLNEINATTHNIYDLNVYMNQSLTTMQIDITSILQNVTAIYDQNDCDGNADSPVCQYVLDINNTLTSVQGDVTSILNIALYLNNTVWNGLTAQDIINQLNASINQINVDSQTILTEIQQSQEFNEELVFLVTDAVGMATQSQNSFDSGDLTSSIDSLQRAQKNLEKAARLLEASKDETQVQYDTMEMNVIEKMTYFIKRWFDKVF